MPKITRVSELRGLNYLNHLMERLTGYLFTGRFKNSKAVGFTFGFSLLTHLVFFPGILKNYLEFFKSEPNPNYRFIAKQSVALNSVFEENTVETTKHQYKLKYRLVLPFLTKVIGRGNLHIKLFFLSLMLGIFFLFQLNEFIQQWLPDNSNSILLLSLLATTYSISAMRLEFIGYGDSLSFLFLLLSASVLNPWILLLVTQLAVWTDERSIFCLVLLILPWWLAGRGMAEKQQKNHFKQVVTICISLMLYFVARIYLENYFYTFDNHQSLSSGFLSEFQMTIIENFKNFGFSIWRGMKGLNAIILLAILLLWINRMKKQAIYVFVTYLATIFCSFIAFDLSRSLNYFYLLPIFATLIVANYLSVKEMRLVLGVNLLTTLIHPDLTFFRFTTGFSIY